MTTLLVVEDDPVYRGILVDLLVGEGYVALPAGGVRDALALSRAQPPDLALIDLRLPDGSGIDVVKHLMEVAPACRSVILSGHGTIPAAVEAMRAGAVDFLTKPVEGPELLAALRDAGEPAPVESLDPDLLTSASFDFALFTPPARRPRGRRRGSACEATCRETVCRWRRVGGTVRRARASGADWIGGIA